MLTTLALVLASSGSSTHRAVWGRQAGREGERGHSNESTLASSEEEAHLMR